MSGAGARRLAARVRRTAGWYLLPVRLAEVAPTRRAAIANGLVALAMPLAERRLRRRGRLWYVQVGPEHRFAVDALADLHVLTEVWVKRIYDVPAARRARTVVDIGANIGASVAFFGALTPGCVIHAFEPDPRAHRKLERNVGDLPGVVLHAVAVGAADGEAVLHSVPDSWASSIVRPPAGDAEAVRVPLRTLAAARRDAGLLEHVDLVKVDAEGAEFEILGADGALDGVGAIVGELHPGLVGAGAMERLLERLAAGYDVRVEDAGSPQPLFSAVRRGA